MLNHKGGFYCYRVHEPKINLLCNGNGFAPLKDFLQQVFHGRPDEYFNIGPRGSMLKFRLPCDPLEVSGHEVSTLARLGLEFNKELFPDNHSKVQVYMLEHDNHTVAMEVPLWMEKHELESYKNVMDSTKPLTGHIDVLRVEGDKIWIWDYKPNAAKEKFAATQVYFYALMLSRRTNLSLDHIRCGYFDHQRAFVFQPTQQLLTNNTSLSSFYPQ
ncbi:PD-(D/E)XK nuclease family protein [Candidatus Woesearchaeota archaeon]|nr:PD-(D/E)XK nuclease family protein [Candidatus Woesearchaeota archaeon]